MRLGCTRKIKGDSLEAQTNVVETDLEENKTKFLMVRNNQVMARDTARIAAGLGVQEVRNTTAEAKLPWAGQLYE